MSGNFFGGQFFGGGFFGAITTSTGAVDPALLGGRKRRRCILPDGTVVWADRTEIRAILDRLSAEYQDEERKIVPTIKRQRKKEDVREIVLSEDIAFPAVKSEIQVLKVMEIPQIKVDPEAMIRSYVEGVVKRKRQKEEEEFLCLMLVN